MFIYPCIQIVEKPFYCCTMSKSTPHLRNIFQFSENDAQWRKILEKFENKVPRFPDKQSCIEFMKMHCKRGSNPMEPSLMHSITTLTDWNQIEQILLPKIIEYNAKWPIQQFKCNEFYKKNRFCNNDAGLYITSRLDLSIHKCMTYQSVLNTLKYLFFHMRCGIYVMIRNKEVVIFAPFVNKNYQNNWGNAFKLVCNAPSDSATQNVFQAELYKKQIFEYYEKKESYLGYQKDNYLPDVSQWWANGNIICNQHTNLEDAASASDSTDKSSNTQWWGDNFFLQLKDMLAETCRCREVSCMSLLLSGSGLILCVLCVLRYRTASSS